MAQFLALASNNESEPRGHCLTQRCEMQMNSNIDNSRPSRKQRTSKLPRKVLCEHAAFFLFLSFLGHKHIHLCEEVRWVILVIAGDPENVLAERKPGDGGIQKSFNSESHQELRKN